MLGKMYYALFGFPGVIAFICTWWKHDRWRAVLTMRLILILVMVVVFLSPSLRLIKVWHSILGPMCRNLDLYLHMKCCSYIYYLS